MVPRENKNYAYAKFVAGGGGGGAARGKTKSFMLFSEVAYYIHLKITQ